MIGPDVQFSLPPRSWFTWYPNNYPKALPPPQPYEDEWTWKAPIAISPELYQLVLNDKIPFIFAGFYVLFILTANSINRDNGNKPYTISKSPLFKLFVFLHNLFLAAYSALTCVAMVRALSVSFPGFVGEHGLPGAVDALCKMNGPRGFGDAITYNTTIYSWASKNYKIHLSDDNLTPDVTDVGRIWNEGLAFWGWLFYVSKYYEVMDNVILLFKGKRVTTLQMYHHAGALLCMWAGIRYMSPPIWMFVLVNSGIHAMMYTYYTFCTVGIRPNKQIKRTITTLQITQFLVGMTYAAAHLFISYSAPYPVAYTVTSILGGMPSAISSATQAAAASLRSAVHHFDHFDTASLAHDAHYVADHAKVLAHNAAHNASSIAHAANSFYHSGLASKTLSSAASQATDSASSLASSLYSEATSTAASLASTASRTAPSLAAQASTTLAALASKALADDGLWLKKLLYRAAGREALAEAIRDKDDLLFGPEFDENLIPRTVEHIKEEVKYRTEYGQVHCLDTEGQAFAIWLNVLYLLPLTGLFFRFFYKTYISRSNKKRTASGTVTEAAHRTSDAVEKAGKGVEQRLDAFGRRVESDVDDFAVKIENNEDVQHLLEVIRAKASKFNTKAEDIISKMKQEFSDFDVDETLAKAKQSVQNVVQNVVDAAHGGDDGEHTEGETETETEHDEEPSAAVKIKREAKDAENYLSTSAQSVADSVKSSVSDMTSSSGTHASGTGSEAGTPSKKKKNKKRGSGLPVPSSNDKKPEGGAGGAPGSAGSTSNAGAGSSSASTNNKNASGNTSTTKSSNTSSSSHTTHANTPTPKDNNRFSSLAGRSTSPIKPSTPTAQRSISPSKSAPFARSASPVKNTSSSRTTHTTSGSGTTSHSTSHTISHASHNRSHALNSSTGNIGSSTASLDNDFPVTDINVEAVDTSPRGITALQNRAPSGSYAAVAHLHKGDGVSESQSFEKVERSEGDAPSPGKWQELS